MTVDEKGWTFEAPKDVGDYHFYGDAYNGKNDEHFKAELHHLKVVKSRDSFIYVLGGQFFFPNGSEPWYGKFKKIDIELPEI